MSETTVWMRDKLLLGQPPRQYLRGLLTPGNGIAAVILLTGVPLIAFRFVFGLGAVTNLSQETPWGLWVGLDVLCGVALAAGGYTLASAVHLFGLERYRPVVRPAVLTGFLGYLFAVIGLLCDLGQPWRIPYPIFYKHGVTSVMFEVGWCVFLYLIVLFLEFTPSLFEWLGLPRLRQRAADLTIGLSALAVVLSTLHQSSLGALFLLAPDKLHPLWYSPLLPVSFFVTSVAAGLSMVIVESSLSHRVFHHLVGDDPHELDAITLGLAQGASVTLFATFFLRLQAVTEREAWPHLFGPFGGLFLLEVVGFVAVPCLVLARAAHHGDVKGARFGAALAVLGVVLNRLDVSLAAFNWTAATRYVPSAAEVLVSLTIITAGVLTFRWIVNRMPILRTAAAH